jgi:membrane protein YdbS with pleckstrin-like domain
MSNARIISILFGLAAVCALMALAWYQTHGGPIVLSKSGFIIAMMAVFALIRVLYALIRCTSRRSKT